MAQVLAHRISSRFAAQRVVFAHQAGDMKGNGLCGGLMSLVLQQLWLLRRDFQVSY